MQGFLFFCFFVLSFFWKNDVVIENWIKNFCFFWGNYYFEGDFIFLFTYENCFVECEWTSCCMSKGIFRMASSRKSWHPLFARSQKFWKSDPRRNQIFISFLSICLAYRNEALICGNCYFLSYWSQSFKKSEYFWWTSVLRGWKDDCHRIWIWGKDYSSCQLLFSERRYKGRLNGNVKL